VDNVLSIFFFNVIVMIVEIHRWRRRRDLDLLNSDGPELVDVQVAHPHDQDGPPARVSHSKGSKAERARGRLLLKRTIQLLVGASRWRAGVMGE